MTDPLSEPPALAGPFQRLGAALAAVPDLGWRAARDWPAWLTRLLPDTTLNRPGRLIIGLSLSGDGKRVTAQVINSADETAARLEAYLVARDAPESELDRIRLLGGRFHPPQIGVWRAWESERDGAGWFFPVAFPFPVALAETPPQPVVAALRVWAETARIRISVGFGRAVLGAVRHSALQILLPGADPSAQLVVAANALDATGLPPFPDAVTDAVRDRAQGALRLSLWLGEAGVIKAGLLIPRPAPDLVDALATVVPPTAPLAAVMAALELAETSVLECHQSEKGLGLTFNFNVPTQDG